MCIRDSNYTPHCYDGCQPSQRRQHLRKKKKITSLCLADVNTRLHLHKSETDKSGIYCGTMTLTGQTQLYTPENFNLTITTMLNKKSARIGLNVNIRKTKYMLITTSQRKMNLYKLCTEGNLFDAVNNFRCPGSMVDNEECIRCV